MKPAGEAAGTSIGMTTKRTLRRIAAAIIFFAIVAIVFIASENSALGGMRVSAITAAAAAQAMSDDNFYGLYRERTLIVSGVVQSVATVNGDTRIAFQTGTLFKAYCDLGSAASTAKPGDAIRIIAESFTAARLSGGILFNNCVQL